MKKQNDLFGFESYEQHQMYWKDVIQDELRKYHKGEETKQDVKDFLIRLVNETTLFVPYWYDEDNDRICILDPDVVDYAKKTVIRTINEMEDESKFAVCGSNSILWNLVQFEAIY